MPPRMTTQSACRSTAAPRGRGTGGREMTEANGGVGGVPDFPQSLLNQGNNRNQNGNAVNDNIQGDIHTRSQEAAVGMAWEDFKTLTREEFCPINEMQKLETEFWNHAMDEAGHAAYTDRFHELARLVPHLVTIENKED
ncbi:reverse transcriptase domain-containing protein [Tanacetum coccineum]